jgi:hypothetical protein
LRTLGRLAATTALLVSAALSGCSSNSSDSSDSSNSSYADGAKPSEPSRRTAAPDTPAEFLALAEEAMAAHEGWRFAVRGSEELVLQGRESGATYSARVRRTTGEPWALHSVGTSRSSKGVTESEEVYVVDGVGHVKEGDAAWRHGPLTDPDIAGKVEDPVAALDTFGAYGDAVSVSASDRRIELRVRTTSAALSAVRDQGVVRKAMRELAPVLEQLRAAGVTVSESGITVERAEETLVLDSSTYEITAHTYRCALRIPSGAGRVRYGQEVTERTSGPYDGAVGLPEGVG